MQKNKKRVVLITGASMGLGLEMGKIYKDHGDIVIGLARSEPHERDVFDNFFLCDVGLEEEVKKTIENISKEYNNIDILINNAGFGLSGAVELTPSENIKKIFDVNVLGCIYVYKYVLSLLRQGSKIINISSVCAFFPLPYRSLYCGSKAALNSIFFGVKMECKPLGIQVTNICPGDIKTNFTKNRVKIRETTSRYSDRIENATNMLDSREDKRMKVSSVANKIYKISNKSSFKAYYIIGAKYKVLNFLMRFFPFGVLIHFTEKFFGGHKKKNEKGER